MFSMVKNQFEIDFYDNISTVIKAQIDILNQHSVMLSEVIPEYYKKKNRQFKLTDRIILDEIYYLFEETSIDLKTYMNIKAGNTSSSAFNVFIIIYKLNDLTSQVNERYKYYGENNIKLPLINLDMLLEPLKG